MNKIPYEEPLFDMSDITLAIEAHIDRKMNELTIEDVDPDILHTYLINLLLEKKIQIELMPNNEAFLTIDYHKDASTQMIIKTKDMSKDDIDYVNEYRDDYHQYEGNI
jgi:hypothetical protein